LVGYASQDRAAHPARLQTLYQVSQRFLPADAVLEEIHVGHLRQYQKERSSSAGPTVVNKEIGTLLQIRRKARIADTLDEDYEPLPLPYSTEPKTITDQQEQDFLRALRSKPEWEMVYCYAILALNTGQGAARFARCKSGT
jgi:hypothetical protein